VATVLVVDDRAAHREIARATLDSGGYRVLEAAEGRQALSLAKSSHPDVVLTDVLMPGVDGYQLVHELREDPDTAAIPVLFYSANYREDEARPLAAACGVSRILSKEATPQELLSAIAHALDDQSAAVAPDGAGFEGQHADTVNAKLVEKVQALDESEARFLAMAEAAPAGVVIADAHGLASYVNPRLSEITQTAAAELLGRGWQHCLGDDQRQALQAGSDCLPPSLLGQRRCERLPLRGGQVRWLAILIRPVRNSELAVTGYVAMIDDVTAVEEANERRRRAERDRQDEQRRQVAARLDSLTRMAGGVAHDFNNLLSIVMSFGQFVREAVEDTAGAQLTQAQAQAILSDMDQVHRASQRAAHLTHQLLTFGGRDTVERAVVDVNVLIGEVLDMISGTIGEHVTITSRLDPQLRHVLASSSQICQVLLNLAVNARDAMPDGGSLHFETANTCGQPGGQAADCPGRDWVRISVTDTGHGMPPAVVQQAMEPFFTTKPLGQGTGLGLATSYGIIKQAGGELIIDSPPGRGTTIHLYLPASDQPVDTSGQAASASASAGQTILVAEDEDGLRDLITRMLTGAGYHVLAASNGQEALALAGRHDDVIHALLTDVVMPAMNGGEVARELRQARPGACVLYMSGYAAPIMTEQGLLDPGVAVVNKPFTRDELLNTLEATLSRQRPREKL
jgi:two-component system cell cycle sensor histidine kinase/response regulator CckA